MRDLTIWNNRIVELFGISERLENMGLKEWADLAPEIEFFILQDMIMPPYVYYSSHRNEIKLYWFKRNIPKSFVYIGNL